jgi:hypothetical protein
VAARWDGAEDMGVPALVTQAQAASRPILERLGFEAHGRTVMLVHNAAGDTSERSIIRIDCGMTSMCRARTPTA